MKTDELLQKENQPKQLKSQINDFDNNTNNDIMHRHNWNFCLVGKHNLKEGNRAHEETKKKTRQLKIFYRFRFHKYL